MAGSKEEAAFYYQASTWEKPRRVVAIRKTEAETWEENQMCLPELEWKEEVIVTNLAWQPYDIWRIYNQRACMENYIKEAKHGFSIDHIPTQDFDANEADLFPALLIILSPQLEPVARSYIIPAPNPNTPNFVAALNAAFVGL
ncbi:transposase [Bacillus fonticola]|uniref:transposase n=1 Tax=Bacillus fonticola TaxID=2728853 RepID=UPI0014764189|nr:transposase [Bacillus fonticola]